MLLDEPFEALAPVIVELMARAVLAMKAEGVAVLLCEQNLAFAAAVSDRAHVIERGQIRFEGTIVALFADEAMREAYLGVGRTAPSWPCRPEGMIGKVSANPEGVREALARARARRACARGWDGRMVPLNERRAGPGLRATPLVLASGFGAAGP